MLKGYLPVFTFISITSLFLFKLSVAILIIAVGAFVIPLMFITFLLIRKAVRQGDFKQMFVGVDGKAMPELPEQFQVTDSSNPNLDLDDDENAEEADDDIAQRTAEIIRLKQLQDMHGEAVRLLRDRKRILMEKDDEERGILLAEWGLKVLHHYKRHHRFYS